MILYNPQDKKILWSVANLHKNNINQGFLSFLGEEFLYCVYKAISLSPNSFLAVFIDKGKVIGFISGTTDLREVKSIMKKKCKFFLLKTTLKLLLRPQKLKKFLETKNYTEKKDEIEAELLSIAVDLNYRGQGVAKKLYLELCKYFSNKGVTKFKIIVGENLREAQKFYIKMGAKKK